VLARDDNAIDRIPLWAAPIASAIIPGLGQARLRKERFVPYMAAEAFLLLKYVKDIREGNDAARTYRAVARDVARRSFAASPQDTIWQYYEKLEKYLESGTFSLSLNGPTAPETDSTTYNGAQWVLARQQFGIPLDDPGASSLPNYPLALSYYESRAVRQAYGWSWRNAQLEQDLFRRSIARSNDAKRRAKLDFSALIANHLLSAVDAFIVVRLTQLETGGVRVAATLPIP
jgi:hypothetical protein